VEATFDLDTSIPSVSGSHSLRTFLNVWGCLLWLARLNRIRTAALRDELVGSEHLAIMERDELIGVMCRYLDVAPATAAALLLLVASPVRDDAMYDLFYRPVIVLADGRHVIAEAFVETARVERNIFAVAGRSGARELAVRGYRPLQALARSLRQEGFGAVLNVRLKSPRPDIDLAICRDRYLFVGQAKVAIDPDTVHEYWSIKEKLTVAAGQLSDCIGDDAAMRKALVSAGLAGASEASEVVPFIVTNVWTYTGATLDGHPVVDISYIKMLLAGGRVYEHTPDGVIERRLLAGDKPSAKELAQLIREPLHREMFEERKLQATEVTVAGRRLIIPTSMALKVSVSEGRTIVEDVE
jgi:hypothetical protein